MNAAKTKIQAIVEANSILNFDNLPTYTDLATAASALAQNPDSIDLRRALGEILDKIPGVAI